MQKEDARREPRRSYEGPTYLCNPELSGPSVPAQSGRDVLRQWNVLLTFYV